MDQGTSPPPAERPLAELNIDALALLLRFHEFAVDPGLADIPYDVRLQI